jgi:hypothetical protein
MYYWNNKNNKNKNIKNKNIKNKNIKNIKNKNIKNIKNKNIKNKNIKNIKNKNIKNKNIKNKKEYLHKLLKNETSQLFIEYLNFHYYKYLANKYAPFPPGEGYIKTKKHFESIVTKAKK